MCSILRITDPIPSDDSIDKYEHFEYEPVTETNLNNFGGNIRIIIQNQDIFTHPSKSFLLIEGRLTKASGTAHADADNISLTNNAMMHLFKNIRYELSGQEIKKKKKMYPGQATTLLGLLKYPHNFSKSRGLNQLWYKDTTIQPNTQNIGWNVRKLYIINNSNPKGTFSFRVPLKHIFRFSEDYVKVVYGFKHALMLTRNDDQDAIFRANAADAGKITLSKISWFMPHVTPANKDKMELYKIIERRETLPVGYRMIQCDTSTIPQMTSFSWRLSVKSSPEVPRFIIVGFHTDKSSSQEQNLSIFDNVNVRSIYVMLNSNKYPMLDYNLSFPKQQFSRAYGDAAEFRSKFFNMNELISNPNFTPAEYRNLYPLYLFEVSKQSEKLKYSTTDIQIKMYFNENVPADTQAFAVTISDRLINFRCDRNKMGVVY